MRSDEADPGTTPGADGAALPPTSDLDRADPADTRSPLEVLASIETRSVLALGQEGTELVDWAALVPDRTGQCPECGLPDGPQHHNKCLAHQRGPSLWAVVLLCLVLPLPLTLVAGPYAYGIFVPTIAVALYVRSR